MHRDNKHLLYPLGCNIIIEDVSTGKPENVLAAHSDVVTCLAIDNTGNYIASGQVTYMGFKVSISSTRYLLLTLLPKGQSLKGLKYSNLKVILCFLQLYLD